MSYTLESRPHIRIKVPALKSAAFAHLVVLLVAALVAAQGAGAAITVAGKVVDENGAPVRDALVTAMQPGINAPEGASSDAAGLFTLEIPAAGIYTIEAKREGFFLFTNQNITLDEGVPLEIRINHLKELAESVDVHYSPPVIDPQQPSDTKQLNSQEILNIPYPASQDYRSALPLMPGAIQDNAGQVHLNGGTTQQANYRLNGFDISDPATGELSSEAERRHHSDARVGCQPFFRR